MSIFWNPPNQVKSLITHLLSAPLLHLRVPSPLGNPRPPPDQSALLLPCSDVLSMVSKSQVTVSPKIGRRLCLIICQSTLTHPLRLEFTYENIFPMFTSLSSERPLSTFCQYIITMCAEMQIQSCCLPNLKSITRRNTSALLNLWVSELCFMWSQIFDVTQFRSFCHPRITIATVESCVGSNKKNHNFLPKVTYQYHTTE